MVAPRSTVFDTGEAPMDMRSGIIATANALGMAPEDLATIISYETAGTFNPTQGGPTTRWGKHRGLIQFGEPQAKQYGVDWNDPLGSQLGPNGAVEKYFRSSGWKPGMSILDAYSIVNAGAPGRYNARDAASGGAPGTVRDKVEQQMGGHRQKAAALLGGDYTAPQGTPGPYAQVGAGDSPSEGGARFGGTGLDSSQPTSPYTLPKPDTKDKYAAAISKGIGSIGGMAGSQGPSLGDQGAAPQLPMAPMMSSEAMPIVSGGGGDDNRNALALLLARLNKNTLWG